MIFLKKEIYYLECQIKIQNYNVSIAGGILWWCELRLRNGIVTFVPGQKALLSARIDLVRAEEKLRTLNFQYYCRTGRFPE